MNNEQITHDTQFSLSYELLSLLRWLTVNEQDRLKKIIRRALDAGLNEEMKKSMLTPQEEELDREVQHSIIDFLGLLEETLFSAINEHTVKRALQKNLMPAIDQIDTSVCDDATVRLSVERAVSTQSARETPKELLMKELLKRWKPSKKTILN